MRFSVVLFSLLSILPVYSQDVYEILDRSDAVIHPQNLQGSFTMTLTSRTGDTRVTRVMAYQKRISENREDRLFLFSFPPSTRTIPFPGSVNSPTMEDLIPFCDRASTTFRALCWRQAMINVPSLIEA